MNALIFLAKRSFVNRIRRSFSSSKRLISLIAVIGYYFFVVMRPMGASYQAQHGGFLRHTSFDLPPLDVIQAFAFAGFAFLTLMLALSTSVQRLSFRPADVDVLFSTPISPKLVLIFRFCRDYLVSLLIPLLPIIFGWRPTMAGIDFLFRNLPHPESAGYLGRAAALAWILVALTWVSIGYAISLFINRSDLLSDRNKKIIAYGGAAFVIALGGYVAWQLSLHTGLSGFVALTQNSLLRMVLFTATAGSTMAMAPLRGEWLPFITSVVGLLSISAGAILIALSQAEWMYDQAAARGFDSLRLRSLQQKGDFYGMAAERARARSGKTRSFGWMMRVKARGPLAILWREVLIQFRMSPIMLIIFAALGIMFGLIPMMVGESDSKQAGVMFLGMQGFTVFIGSMSISQSGFIELLRRVDLVKPLPFTSTVISFAEVAAKALPSILSLLIASIVCFVIQPSLWPFCVASLVALPFVAVLCCSVVYLVTLIFPDLDDPSLRGFRGLVIMLGLLFALFPVIGAGLGIGLVARSISVGPIIAAAVSAIVAIGISSVICMISGNLYAQFNPSE